MFLHEILKFPFSLKFMTSLREIDRINNSPRPRINARHFKSIVPCSGISALIFRARTDAMSVCFTILPTAAERSAVFEVKATATDLCSLLGTGLLRLWWQRILHFVLFCFNMYVNFSLFCYRVTDLWNWIWIYYFIACSSPVRVFVSLSHLRSHNFA